MEIVSTDEAWVGALYMEMGFEYQYADAKILAVGKRVVTFVFASFMDHDEFAALNLSREMVRATSYAKHLKTLLDIREEILVDLDCEGVCDVCEL